MGKFNLVTNKESLHSYSKPMINHLISHGVTLTLPTYQLPPWRAIAGHECVMVALKMPNAFSSGERQMFPYPPLRLTDDS